MIIQIFYQSTSNKKLSILLEITLHHTLHRGKKKTKRN